MPIIFVFISVLFFAGGAWFFYQGSSHKPVIAPIETDPGKQAVDDQEPIRKIIQDFYSVYEAKDGKLLMNYFTPAETDLEQESYDWLVANDLEEGERFYRIFLRMDISNPKIGKIEKIGDNEYKVAVEDELKSFSNETASWDQPQKRKVYFILKRSGDAWQIDQFVLDGYVKRPKYSGFGQEPIEYPSEEGAADKTAYRITTKEIVPANRESLYLKYFLAESFGFPQNMISNIVFDTREGIPNDNIYNSSYYIIVDNGVELKNEYKNKDISIRTERADQSLIPYIEDPDYCRADTDCVVRKNFCSYGAYNYYHAFLDVWGCENGYYPEEDEDTLEKACDTGTQHAEVNYTNAKCVDHRCAGQGGTITCAEGVPI